MSVQNYRDASSDMDHFDILPFIAVMLIVLATLLFVTMVMASINIGIGAGEGWIPMENSGTEKKSPVLAEWDGETIIIQRPTGKESISIGRNKDLWWNKSTLEFKSSELLKFMSEMNSQKDKSYVLFAVRPSGFENFQSLAAEFRSKGISIGYEPIEKGKRIKLIKD